MRKIRYSREADILTLKLSEKPIDHAEEVEEIIVHFSADNEPVLIEILDAKGFISAVVSSLLEGKEISTL